MKWGGSEGQRERATYSELAHFFGAVCGGWDERWVHGVKNLWEWEE